jgi:3-methylfumaryl-CoA hydratase
MSEQAAAPDYAAWIGKRESRTDLLAPAPIMALSALLDRDDRAPEAGDPLPPSAHWLYFHAPARQSGLGADGHPERGGFLPPIALPRRMWAGGRIEFPGTLRVGETATRLSVIEEVQPKQGRSGPLVFVAIRHEYRGAAGLALVERQELVFREAPQRAQITPPAAVPAPSGAAGAPWRRLVDADPVLLFRYSAVTMNGHRIHYDAPYATGVEGYPGLVVHGPLLATLLLDLARRSAPNIAIKTFIYKALSPIFAPDRIGLCGRPHAGGADLWAERPDGGIVMQARIEPVTT